MLHKFLQKEIIKNLDFTPTQEQYLCIEQLALFCTNREPMQCFVLKGFAGTGKTSIVSALVKAFEELEQNSVLLAPTGRAAKIFASYSDKEANSIHKKIYRQKSISDFRFVLDFNRSKDTLFIVDEASMIGDSYSDSNIFGSGKLLDDLIEYVYSGNNCRMILLGDTAQLLPVGQSFSPALDKRILQRFSLEITEFQLTEVVRQASDSGILVNATEIRRILENNNFRYPKIDTNFDDVKTIGGADFIEHINSSYREVGEENTIVITRSNKQANTYNRGIRNMVLQIEEELSNNDLLMVVKNNYFWAEKYENINFIANGDTAQIVRIKKHKEMYGCRFADATIRLVDYDMEIDCKLLIDSLFTATPKENDALGKKLFEEVEKDYEYITSKRKKYLEMRQNEYLNALQIKFAYSITCHKAQGGQWQHVYVDCGYLTDEMLGNEFLQWLYTAVTRSQTKLFFVNLKKEFIETARE